MYNGLNLFTFSISNPQNSKVILTILSFINLIYCAILSCCKICIFDSKFLAIDKKIDVELFRRIEFIFFIEPILLFVDTESFDLFDK